MSCLNSRLKIEDKDNQIKKKNAPNEVILLKLTWFLKKKEKEVEEKKKGKIKKNTNKKNHRKADEKKNKKVKKPNI